ncbi:polynucleotide adenylyltransferase [Stygiomarasmius scandens]|uniref:Poly(A) polymerase n=1 Tax=Marasmiellus scandens TaxID=2682957 RepID=A0ABR1JZJ2_9AGAR
MANEGSYLGVTPPISTQESTEREKEVTLTLMEELRRQGTFESEEEARTRELVLGRVSALVKKFVKVVGIKRGLSEAAASAAGGKIFTFGSYRLGVHGPGSDIDTLCVVPKHVSREDFFEVFESMLREFEGATEVAGVPEAYVPIITASINGIPIDFLMARLALSTIPEDLSLQDDNLLRNIDERCVRSLGGSRVANAILELVPNVQVFRDSLRCIKLWAQRRAIYSNVNGFFGGVAWAMLVARICQLYPNAIAGAIVSRFFIIMYQWSWPQPVLLKQIEEGPLQVKVWNPKLYPADRSHRMPIITPTYPAMCATHNVTASTQMITTEEFKRGSDIVDKVIVGSASWSELFAKHDFFHKYRYYLQIIASTGNADLQIKWSGTVESRIRQLVMKLEYVDSLMLAHPFVKGFEQVSYCVSDEEVRAVAQGDISETIAKRKKEDIEGKEGAGPVYTTTFYVGLAVEPKQPGSVGPRKLDISYPTTEFTKLVKMWEKFDEGTMGIVVRNIKSSSLPDNVFDPGERQPKQAQKRTKVRRYSLTSPTACEPRLCLKGSSKSNNTSPEMPSSKRIRTSNNASKEQPATTVSDPNGSIPPLSITPVVETAGAFAPKDSSAIKSPQLPLGENAAIATSVQ